MITIWKRILLCTEKEIPKPHNKFLKGCVLGSSLNPHKALIDEIINALDAFELWNVTRSTKWKNWAATLDLRTCLFCSSRHGKIYAANEMIDFEPPVHDNCRCEINYMKAVFKGYATLRGQNGADYWLVQYGTLPEYYFTKEEAKQQGWKAIAGNLADVAPGMMIGGDVYKNRDGHLPEASGRIWYEADINYTAGFRTRHRILYSNDGLVFVTYDHYDTFYEII